MNRMKSRRRSGALNHGIAREIGPESQRVLATGGYRPNVRTFINRIRKKLRAVDPEFEHIQNYAGFGYRYHRSAG
jgi:hypothetical protein